MKFGLAKGWDKRAGRKVLRAVYPQARLNRSKKWAEVSTYVAARQQVEKKDGEKAQ